MITLVLGGNKSGKSDFALDLLTKGAEPGLFIATGKAKDMDFREQIRRHRQSRTPNLEVIEVSEDLPQELQKAKLFFPTLLVDSLDYWLFACREAGCESEKVKEFMAVLDEWNATDLILVSCETGLGPLPGGSAVRAFVRSLGALNQSIAARADRAYLVAAGLPLTLKQG
ncbi:MULTISPECIES: bifunctional adenosylcobinamide kinase/adenosylcobinamide-phosphate guanylyltransferase [unclassified Pseudodesulfovibrio]|uniref:bifunctional adenosylcobinamide kinase/adenosylcobinamide-phosphate guanylyltransferase n=1 Tax=unclassified Pseudodesulfovibrio TaxID=2661612 RepID=UPI000FEBA1D3|nr:MULTISPECIES: bifunctional adenosylcobinamide kinase/adenosylcobinamide-phosphate guanylyltransferase [unclassified Pseudodesulfovibrio]MCJ2166080.1 bifunctional adenosylcobinamide kinase/adenosylcobinamide-phosphate guanylyltransferase [Pseudodesulfovibrio sp. S3-i]RWU02433.1 cobalamin biosynthesis protein [Pseudodesulfovibrio sp. S3]